MAKKEKKVNEFLEKYGKYKEYKELPKGDLLRYGNEFVDDYILDEKFELTITAHRIIANIISNIRISQFQAKNQPQQLKLFEDEFTSDHNLLARMKIKNSSITNNIKYLKKAYEQLYSMNAQWHKFTTSDGREISSFGGLISNLYHQEKGYTYFTISAYWLKKLLEIPEYNTMEYQLFYKLSQVKHIAFAFWLSKIPMEGTQVKKETLNKKFNLDYAEAKDLGNRFLKPIKNNLDKYHYKSFNYKTSGDLIFIKPYSTKQLQLEGLLPQTELKIRRNYTLRYIKERHQLKEEHCKEIDFYWKGDEIIKSNELVWFKNIILDAYDVFIKKCREDKKKATDYTGQNFLDELQKHIIEVYSTREKEKRFMGANGYPKIV